MLSVMTKSSENRDVRVNNDGISVDRVCAYGKLEAKVLVFAISSHYLAH